MLSNVGWPELMLILLVALLLFGPRRLAEVGGALGKALKDFRRGLEEPEDPHGH